MKNKGTYRWLKRGLAFTGIYLLLLTLLAAAESSHPDASIRSISDALWYSLVTLSTVGYGDSFPVTFWGRVLGLLFVLMSTGLLAFLIGMAATALFSRLLPGLRLVYSRNRNWYLFPGASAEAAVLAKHLLQEDRTGLVIFPGGEGKLPLEDPRCIHCPDHLPWIRKHKANGNGSCTLFFLENHGFSGESQVRLALEYGWKVYCAQETGLDSLPENLRFFDRFACCARLYWQRFPASPGETVILVGSGSYAQALLETGLQRNIRHPEQGIDYHVFGDWAEFCRNHPRLMETLTPETLTMPGDRVIFHREPWNQEETLLLHAGRIVLCEDSLADNQTRFLRLHRYFPVSGKVYLLADREVPGGIAFGTPEELFTPELVMGHRLNRTAMTMHRIYRESTGNTAPAWEELSEFLRQSNIAAADHLLTKIRLLLEDDSICDITPDLCARAYAAYREALPEKADFFRSIEHLRWMRFHQICNWRYAPQRNNARREHPLLRPYGELSPPEQAKDDYAWEMLELLAREAE